MSSVAICIPTYNGEEYLPCALDSIRRQTFEDWEIIAVEDGTKDGAEALIGEFARSVVQPVRYLRHELNQGLPSTRNTAIRAATSPFVALLDVDDYWAANHLQSMMDVISVTRADVVHSGSILFEDGTGRELTIRAPQTEDLENVGASIYRHTYIIQPSSAMIRKEVFNRIGLFDVSFRFCEDMEFWFRVASTGLNIAYTGQQTCYYRKHSHAMSVYHSAELVEGIARVYAKYLNWDVVPRSSRIKTTSTAFFNAGRMFFRNDPRRAAKDFFRAWTIMPFGLDAGAFAILSLFNYHLDSFKPTKKRQ